MKKKAFDCVEMKREAAREIYQRIKDMTFQEKAAYWRQRSQEFRRLWEHAVRHKQAG